MTCAALGRHKTVLPDLSTRLEYLHPVSTWHHEGALRAVWVFSQRWRSKKRTHPVFARELDCFSPKLRSEVDQIILGRPLEFKGWQMGDKRLSFAENLPEDCSLQPRVPQLAK